MSQVWQERPLGQRIDAGADRQLVIQHALAEGTEEKPVMQFKLSNNRTLTALIDSGASDSMISVQRAEPLNLKTRLCRTKQYRGAIDRIPTIGYVDGTMVINGKEYPIRFVLSTSKSVTTD